MGSLSDLIFLPPGLYGAALRAAQERDREETFRRYFAHLGRPAPDLDRVALSARCHAAWLRR